MMSQQIGTPQQQLSKKIINVWVIKEIIANIIFFLVLGILFYLDVALSWPTWAGWTLLTFFILTIIGIGWSIFLEPSLKYKSWRYDANEDFFLLKHGIFTEKNQIIPMTKIQSVATNQGPIMKKHGLYSVSVTTMASTHTIPALSEEIAIELKENIAHFAKIKEVE